MEALLFWLVLGLALGAGVVWARGLRAWASAGAVLLAVASGGGQAAVRAARGRREAAERELHAALPAPRQAGGYVSSDACRACHPAPYASWHRTFHRTMTQAATAAAVRGNFDGQTLHADGQRFLLWRRGDQFGVRTPDRGEQRIDMVTGSHHMQVYWLPAGAGNAQHDLPFTYLLEDRRWVARRDAFLLDPELPKLADTWNRNCIECHSTAGQPRIEPGSGVPASRVAELGIGCEACHGPGADHIAANRSPLRRFGRHAAAGSAAAAPTADPTISNPARLGARAASEVCGQCHGIGCNLDDWPQGGLRYRPGQDLEQFRPLVRAATLASGPCRRPIAAQPGFAASRYWRDGMVRVSGREYSALHESRCFRGGHLSCQSCHSMHASDPDDQIASGRDGDGACLSCHPSYGADLLAHTHHRAASPGSRCQNCHMPYTTYGLLKAIRSHLIDSPSVHATLMTGRPDACSLCHLDRTLAWTAAALARWYGQPVPNLSAEQRQVPAAVLHLLRGDAGQRALAAYSMGWSDALLASGSDWEAPLLAQRLDDPYAAVRYLAYRSLRRLPGFAAFSYDFVGAPAERAAARARALATVRAGPGRLALPTEQMEALERARDNRSMFLAE
ncbi:MAG TPA: multiheme c-type cytochrome [Polyangia bacterium]|nr:multiheme c-type cytochrome [Polyangia bacterium]